MLHYETYVKYSLEGILCALEDEFRGAKPARRDAIAAEREAITSDYDAFVDLARALPRFPDSLFDRVFPKRSKKGELYVRIKPADAREAIVFLDAFDACPLAHREGERTVYPWTAQSETHRVFPYTVIVQTKPTVFCRIVWCHEYQNGSFTFIRMQLPDELREEAVDASSGVLKNSMFVAGLAPYVYVQTNEFGRQIGLRFPKAYTPSGDGRFRLLTWRDIPLLRDAEAKKPNQAPEPTTTAVTPPAAQEPRQP
jgi:hypothetical protein